jgi:hypothetical protein
VQPLHHHQAAPALLLSPAALQQQMHLLGLLSLLLQQMLRGSLRLELLPRLQARPIRDLQELQGCC